MGSSQSSSVKQTVEVLNKTMTTMVTKNTNSASAKNTNSNSFRITIGEKGDVKNCKLNLTQKINAKQAVKVMAKFASKADLQTQMKAALKNEVDQSSQSTQDALATSIGVQNSKQEINQKISNIVETNITNETVNEVNGFLDNLNSGELEIKGKWDCGTNGPIEINQSIVADQIVELLSDAMIGNSVTTATDTTTAATSKQVSKSEQKGVIDALGGLISSAAFAILAPIIAIVIIIAVLMFVFKGSISKIAEKKAGVSFGTWLFGRKKFRFGARR